MPSVESFIAELGGSTGSFNVNSNGGFEPEAGNSREISAGGGGSRSKRKDLGTSRRIGRGGGGGDTGSQSGLEGIISSSRMRVGTSRERVALEGGGRRRDGGRGEIKMPRPKTASATIGRGESTLSAGSASGGFNRVGQAYMLRLPETSHFLAGPKGHSAT